MPGRQNHITSLWPLRLARSAFLFPGGKTSAIKPLLSGNATKLSKRVALLANETIDE